MVYYAACAILKRGVFAMMGSTTDSNADVISSHSTALHMPYVTTGIMHSVGDYSGSEKGFIFSLSIPYDRAIIDVIRHYMWTSVYYVYDSEFGRSC